MKRMIAWLLVWILLLGMVPGRAYAASEPFTDVNRSDYFYLPVRWAVKEGITTGVTATTFEPYASCTRAQMVTFLWRAAGAPERATGGNPFTDVPDNAWYAEAVLWAAENGITTGMTATTFEPDLPCTRGQVVTFLWRAYGRPQTQSGGIFEDVSTEDYFHKAVLWAAEQGITTGMTEKLFGPESFCLRAQIVTFLYRAVLVRKNHTVTFESGTQQHTLEVPGGVCVAAPEDPVWEGYVFEGWYLDPEGMVAYDFSAPVNESLTLYALWEETEQTLIADDDGDGIPNALEELFELSAQTDDTDADGINDYTELYVIGSDPALADSHTDLDGDGLSNLQELGLGSDPACADTDADGLHDGAEQAMGTAPNCADTDGDGLWDGKEITLNTDPLHFDRKISMVQEVSGGVMELSLTGAQAQTLQLTCIDTGSLPGALGAACMLQVDGALEQATVRFELRELSGVEPTVYYYDEASQILKPLKTTIRDGVAQAVVPESGSYVLLDRQACDEALPWEAESFRRIQPGAVPMADTDSDGDGIPDFCEEAMVAFDGTPIALDKHDPDTDSDGLVDGQEVTWEVIYAEDGTYYVLGTLISDPTVPDSDFDGRMDSVEASEDRMDNRFLGTMGGYYALVDTAYSFDLRTLFGDSRGFDPELAAMSLVLSNSAYGEDFSFDAGETVSGIGQHLAYHGFTDVAEYDLTAGFDRDGIVVAPYTDDHVTELGIGHHRLTVDGETKTVLAIVIRGTDGSVAQWSSNFDMGDPDSWTSEDHMGFQITRERIYAFVRKYIDTYLADCGDLVWWVTGHSRGGALANLLAARLIEDGEAVYAYTFASPTTTTSPSRDEAAYAVIHNVNNAEDVIPSAPLSTWDFGRYGVDHVVSVKASGLETLWRSRLGLKKYNALNQNVIALMVNRIDRSCSGSREEVFDWDWGQNLTDAQYECVSQRAKRFCGLTERKSLLGRHIGYRLYPSTAFVFQLGAEAVAGDAAEQAAVVEMAKELWNSKFAAALLLFLGDAVTNLRDFRGLTLGESLIGDGHCAATYYVLLEAMVSE